MLGPNTSRESESNSHDEEDQVPDDHERPIPNPLILVVRDEDAVGTLVDTPVYEYRCI